MSGAQFPIQWERVHTQRIKKQNTNAGFQKVKIPKILDLSNLFHVRQ